MRLIEFYNPEFDEFQRRNKEDIVRKPLKGNLCPWN